MSITDAQRKAHNKFFKGKYSQIKLSLPNKEAEELREYCAAHGLKVAGFIRDLVKAAIAARSATPGE